MKRRIPKISLMRMIRSRGVALLAIILVISAIFAIHDTGKRMDEAYRSEISPRIVDRTGATLAILPNARGGYMTPKADTPTVDRLVVLSEDRYFRYHLGVNPVSMARSALSYLRGGGAGGSTVTQQLAKNLLHQENERTIGNKIEESLVAIAIELTHSKDEILRMYLDTAYFGASREGIEEASRRYYAKSASALTEGEAVRLLAMLSAPSFEPGSARNDAATRALSARLGVTDIPQYSPPPSSLREPRRDEAMFEMTGLAGCPTGCRLTIDRELTQEIRGVVSSALASPKWRSVTNAAVAVIAVGKGDEPNRLLALVGSPDPESELNGAKINMALQARPIGSTWKPFIYGKAVEKGARPYTLIDDEEYRYDIGTGFAFYPKNYDGRYRGEVTLHYALSNSLNVPAVRALSFVGVDDFSRYMEEDLRFEPKQSLDTYQLSIALGGLEMHPLLLAEYYTALAREGALAPLSVEEGKTVRLPMLGSLEGPRRVMSATATALVSSMLSDRLMGVEQFGLGGNLDLPFEGYAVKTGTTYDYHDSWTVGYTPDIVVATWIGNSDNKPMDLLSGARGAGKIWHDTMALLHAKGYLSGRGFDDRALATVETPEGTSFGILGDDTRSARIAMKESSVVLEPHDGDVIRYEEGMAIALHAKEPLQWTAGEETVGYGKDLFFAPASPGDYLLVAKKKDGPEVARIRLRVTR